MQTDNVLCWQDSFVQSFVTHIQDLRCETRDSHVFVACHTICREHDVDLNLKQKVWKYSAACASSIVIRPGQMQ